MFHDNQIKELSKQLDKNRIKVREKSGINLQYLETYDVINEANRIFNYMWNYTITNLEEVARETNQNGNHVITFSAIVKIKVYDGNGNYIEREDTGVGVSVARSLGEAIDNSSKSAVSDGLKRCFRTLGVTFGNNLYSKSQSDNNHDKPQNQQHYQNVNNQPTQRASSQNFDRYEFQSLYNIGLDVVEQNNGFLVVMGENQYAYRDAIKASGFKFDPKSKTWWKSTMEQGAA